MSKMGLFYTGSYTNVAESVQEIQKRLSCLDLDMQVVHNCLQKSLFKYDLLLFGIPNWCDGVVEDDWNSYLENLTEEHLFNKSVAIFGLGEEEYCESFVDAMQTIYSKVSRHGSVIVGTWPPKGYSKNSVHRVPIHESKKASWNQVNEWIESVTPYFSK
ncbi:MAG: flavodoxin domain-containing protein [Campylobacterales bacterium]|nr:flavodoxin domain-containing protein [Campylobacterales bacterium]